MICDLAETYHILNYQGLPIDLLATLVAGLRDNSRVKRKIMGIEITPTQMLTLITDNLSLIRWAFQTEGDMPELFSSVYAPEKPKEGFASAEEFLKAWEGGE